MNELMKFDFNGNAITTITDEKGEPWFVAKEVCDVLGYTNGPDAVAKHCKHSKIISIAKRDGIRGNPNKTIIPESDLYRLVLRSKLPEAEKFEAWVTETVLPAIRKTGGYIAGEEQMDEDQLILKAMQVLQKKVEEKQKVIDQMSPKAQVFDALINTETTFSFTDAAKKLGVGPRKLIAALHDREVLYGSRHTPKAYFMNRGYFEVKAVVIEKYQTTTSQTRVTPKGLAWLSKNLEEKRLEVR